MGIEQKIQAVMGNLMFSNTMISQQLEDSQAQNGALQTRIAALEKKLTDAGVPLDLPVIP